MGLTDLGYHRKTYDEYLTEKKNRAKELFGEDIETNEQTTLGKILCILAYALATEDENSEKIYYSRYNNTATGISLDRLCPREGIDRNSATYAEYTLTVNGDGGTTVTELIVSGMDDEIVFHNIEPFAFDENGIAIITVQCEIAGTQGNGITIDNIVKPVANVSGITNSIQTVVAEEVESDYDLRRKLNQAANRSGGSSTSAIRAAVLKVPTVKSVNIIENTTNETVNGRPPHSFEVYVYGGNGHETEIAQAIFDSKAAGIQSHGSLTYNIIDSTGHTQTVKYSAVATKPVIISCTYIANNNFPANGETLIQNNIMEYINDFDLEQSLIMSSLYGYIYSVDGVSQVPSLQVSTDGGITFTNNDVTIDANSVITCSRVDVGETT